MARDAELAELERALAERAAGLVYQGEAGIGKTALWEHAVATARGRGATVLVARASTAEEELGFAGLSDLLGDVDLERITDVPDPQRLALGVVTLRSDPVTPAPEERAVGLGTLSVLRRLSEDQQVVVAVDDVQWLDPPSARALAFAARRLDGAAVMFLLARRGRRPTLLESAFARRDLRVIEVAGLDADATRRLLAVRLGIRPVPRELAGIVETAQGNPLFALELGRSYARDGGGGDVWPPDSLESALGVRVSELPADVRRLLLGVSLSGSLAIGSADALAGQAVVDAANASGVVVVDGESVRASHPLLASFARRRSRPAERRAMHLELAALAETDERQVRHLAAAATAPEAAVSARVLETARQVFRRGLTDDAVQLAGHALRLTPEDSDERWERVLFLGECLVTAGEAERVTALLEPLLAELPPGRVTARAHVLLSDGTFERLADVERHLEIALAESADDPATRALALSDLAICRGTIRLTAVADQAVLAEESLALATSSGDAAALESATEAVAWCRVLRGQPLDDLWTASPTGARAPPGRLAHSVERLVAVGLRSRGMIAESETLLEALRSAAEERGQVVGMLLMRLHLCELALRAGDWERAEHHLQHWEADDRKVFGWSHRERCLCHLHAGRGELEAARSLHRMVEEARSIEGACWDMLELGAAAGLIALLERDPARASERFGEVWSWTEREGILDPGVFPVAPDLVEALCEIGDLGQARTVADRLAELAERQAHPWAQAGLLRSRGVLALASDGDADQAAKWLEQAAGAYHRQGLQFDLARTHLALGRWSRRRKRRGLARTALGRAQELFASMGSAGWADLARDELGSVSGRRASEAGALTPAQARVAHLAASGLSNAEIATALLVSVHTVEAHLTRVYATLGVHSRVQLARRMDAIDASKL